jgi:hypothetical protein
MQPTAGIDQKHIFSNPTLRQWNHFLKELCWRGEQRMVGELLLNLGVTFKVGCYL